MNRHLFDTPSADPIVNRQRQISAVLHNAALTKLTNCKRLCAESTGCSCCAVKRLRWSQSKCSDDSESAGTMVLPLATTESAQMPPGILSINNVRVGQVIV